MLDGRVERLKKKESLIGLEFDSISDWFPLGLLPHSWFSYGFYPHVMNIYFSVNWAG